MRADSVTVQCALWVPAAILTVNLDRKQPSFMSFCPPNAFRPGATPSSSPLSYLFALPVWRDGGVTKPQRPSGKKTMDI